jgi:hypothetical protein
MPHLKPAGGATYYLAAGIEAAMNKLPRLAFAVTNKLLRTNRRGRNE